MGCRALNKVPGTKWMCATSYCTGTIKWHLLPLSILNTETCLKILWDVRLLPVYPYSKIHWCQVCWKAQWCKSLRPGLSTSAHDSISLKLYLVTWNEPVCFESVWFRTCNSKYDFLPLLWLYFSWNRAIYFSFSLSCFLFYEKQTLKDTLL